MFLVTVFILFVFSTTGATEIDYENQSTDVDVQSCRCPTGFTPFEGHCYFFGQDRLTWYDAVTVCELVVTNGPKSWISQVKNYTEKVFLRKNLSGSDAWIGGTDVLNHGRFIWYGYSDMPAEDWFGSKIPAAKEYAQCLLLDKYGKIRADRCLRQRHFICEQKPN